MLLTDTDKNAANKGRAPFAHRLTLMGGCPRRLRIKFGTFGHAQCF